MLQTYKYTNGTSTTLRITVALGPESLKGRLALKAEERLLERVTFRRIIEYRRKGGELEGRGESRDNWQDKLGD